MVRALAAAFAVFVMSGCLAPSAIECGDGRTCPAGSTCDDVRSLCLTEAQTTACNGIVDGKPCDAAGTPGICDRGFCEPGCGDGQTGPDEECDDGNFASHDGCSSRCAVEVPTWSQLTDAWHGLNYPSAVYHQALGRFVVFGGFDENGGSNAIWQIDPARMYEVEGGWIDVSAAFTPSQRPPALRGAGIAYDPVRQVIVIHGGDDIEGKVHGETWEYAAGGGMYGTEPIGVWTQTTPAVPSLTNTPGPLWPPNLAFDTRLGKVVLHGGFGPNDDPGTWAYNGTWTKLAAPGDPGGPPRPSLAFDETRQTLVTFTTASNDPSIKTFEFTGTDWVEQTSLTTRPPRRQGAMFAYHPGLQKLVLFGGQTNSATGPEVLADTWTYDGTWQQVGGVSPPGRRTGALVADPVNQRVWLIGGIKVDGSAPLEDEWELTSAGWTQRTPRFGPPNSLDATGAYSREDHSLFVYGGGSGNELWSHDGTRWRHEADAVVTRLSARLAYDPDQRRLVLTGGDCTDQDPDCDLARSRAPTTYALDIDTRVWTKLSATWPATAMRLSFGFSYDRAAHRFVAFGGNVDGEANPDTWALDGSSWTQLASTEHPPADTQPMMSFDPERGTTLLFDSEGDTWELQGSQWTKLIDQSSVAPTLRQPPGRFQSAMTYDPTRKRHVLVAGFREDGVALSDVWELDSATLTWSEVFVAGSTPLPRHAFVLARHDNLRATMLYGGAAGSLFARNDVWILKYTSTTPDEVCTDGMDTDGDMQLDDEDPDCDPLP